MPETPKIIKDETNLLFFWEKHGSMDYFKSVAHPKLFIATKQEKLVHMASGPPSITDFQNPENNLVLSNLLQDRPESLMATKLAVIKSNYGLQM